MEVFHTHRPWNDRRPETLVIACSDGRFQEEVDEFLQRHLAIDHYDRLYVPGGAGVLATGADELIRADRFRAECQFLIGSHRIERAILMFHGPAEDRPTEALCSDYRRRLPASSSEDIRRRQEQDAEQIQRDGLWDGVRLEVYRCEVKTDGLVRFVQMHV
jgi:hypothetical protein